MDSSEQDDRMRGKRLKNARRKEVVGQADRSLALDLALDLAQLLKLKW
jgi:hypothetical protein